VFQRGGGNISRVVFLQRLIHRGKRSASGAGRTARLRLCLGYGGFDCGAFDGRVGLAQISAHFAAAYSI
jgi:hypothetical protein